MTAEWCNVTAVTFGFILSVPSYPSPAAPDYERTLPQLRGVTLTDGGLAIPCSNTGNSSEESKPIKEDMRLSEVKTGV